MSHRMSEDAWEHLALDTLGELFWKPLPGAAIAPGSGSGERVSWDDVVIPSRLRTALITLNPGVPRRYLDQALAAILAPLSQDPIAENYRIHRFMTEGFRGITYIDDEGQDQTPTIHLVSAEPNENDWRAVNQVTIVRGDHGRRFDVVLYLNGMPVCIVELKNAGSARADVGAAHAQLQTYLREFPLAFRFAVAVLASDGISAKYGTPFTPLNQERYLQILRGFVAFDEGPDGLAKRIAKPHQYFAVTKAVGSTVQAVGTNGKAGVVWHTQGSGKSMEMELYANQVIRHPRLRNPTIVVVTDRNELDGQLYEGFRQSLLLPEHPVQVRRRADHPLLSDRSNIIVIVDEAHRSHDDDLDGYARHLRDALPRATLIAFTGTPISFDDRNTQAVFGDYIDIYDLTRAVQDGATVPVYFESRLVKVQLAAGVTEDTIDAAADEVTAGLDDVERARIEQSVAVVNAVYGAPERIAALATDLVGHWEARRAEMMKYLGTPEHPNTPGKAMIVGATREICARLYAAIVALRPDWHSDDLATGRIKVVYSGTPSDVPPVVDHVRRDSANAAIKQRMKDPDDELEIVIVKDMMLTGFDAPPLHTLYLDRPLKGALLMQTLARVNRTFRGKQDGLLVAYAPLAENLAKALAEYTDTDQENRPIGRTIEEAVTLTQSLLARLGALLTGHDWRARLTASGPRSFLTAVTSTVNYLRSPATPGNQVKDGEETVGAQFRRLSSQLARVGDLRALRRPRPAARRRTVLRGGSRLDGQV